VLLGLLKEKPPTPPHAGQEPLLGVFQGMGHIVRQRDMRLVMLIFFFGLGIFNAISTCIDQICQVKGLTMDQTGQVGGIMLVAGLVGAVILPLLSDKLRKRKVFIVIAMALSAPGLIGLTFAHHYYMLLAASFIMGFFLLGAGAPVGFQYSAEVTRPAPESTSQGLLLLLGQISGIVFIVGINIIGIAAAMGIFIGFAAINIILSLLLNESEMILER
jgi:MFS family permease